MNLSLYRTILLSGIILATFFLLQDVTGVQRVPIKKSLSYFPTKIDTWQVISKRNSSDSVIQLLGVDDYIEYNYQDIDGHSVNFYAAFYEAVGNGTGYHSPKNCIPGGGWGIDEINTISITPKERSKSVKISEMIIRNGSEYQVVFYWYQNRGRIISSEYFEKIYLVLDSIFKNRRDGTFIRLMSYAPNKDIKGARQRLIAFAEASLPELDNFIPGGQL
ncbi:exosortase C-terminal domain/associated protein EpsI [Desulfogranum marinum]|uniref:exosortase C-terminal domain/associated protein EpsI n=1 Tax=Desulfogranum marinum TaxID=453220 RepID=UPI0029C80146|nr:exosortase C-terminal domain/associated protein EpsI [Desulfogranum marinum]